MNVSSLVTTEFDGMYKVQMTLSPARPLAVKSLKVIVPIKPEFARLFPCLRRGHSLWLFLRLSAGWQNGRVYGIQKQVDGQPMLVGSFIPYIWIGNDKAGFAGLPTATRAGLPNDAVPAIEIRRDTAWPALTWC